MVRRRQALFITLLVVAALAGLFWLLQQVPWRYEEVDRGFAEEARRNPFLAAELFLKQQDVTVSSARGLSRLDNLPVPDGATLLIYSTEGMLSQAQTQRLWQWIEQGGHLIINANSYNDPVSGQNRSVLFQRLGLATYPLKKGDSRIFTPVSIWFNQKQGECLDEKFVFDLEMEQEPEPLKIALHSNAVLENQGELESIAVANEDGIQMMRYFIGGGMVTVASDLAFWSNRQIACYDHAYLLWNMIGTGEVLILSHAEVPSIFSLLWQQASLAVALLLLLLAAWLWRRSRRFGPLLQWDHSRRRSLGEHLHASAMFAWRNAGITATVDELRRSIRAHMILRHPGYKQLTRNEQYQLIARLAEIEPEQVSRALTQKEIDKPQQLVDLVQRLQQIRNRI